MIGRGGEIRVGRRVVQVHGLLLSGGSGWSRDGRRSLDGDSGSFDNGGIGFFIVGDLAKLRVVLLGRLDWGTLKIEETLQLGDVRSGLTSEFLSLPKSSIGILSERGGQGRREA